MSAQPRGTKPQAEERPAGPSDEAGAVDLESTPITRPEYIAAIVHLYRGELSRANLWRLRLDTTTNWAIFSTAAMLSFAFAEAYHTHLSLLLGMLLILVFLGYEARRFRIFDVWRSRARMIEENFYGPILRRRLQSPKRGWGRLVAEDLLHPSFKITFWQAFRARLLRNYLAIFLIVYLAWWLKILMHPVAAGTREGESLLAGLRSNIEAGQSPIPWWITVAFASGLLLFLALSVLVVPPHPHGSPDAAYWPREEEQDEHPLSPLDV
ncbi:MAG: DUF2270 domain-containing protein [Planctomycetes bacterium]|nr:DUF2270 domain-containing protein [Planctomycetota bacterium]